MPYWHLITLLIDPRNVMFELASPHINLTSMLRHLSIYNDLVSIMSIFFTLMLSRKLERVFDQNVSWVSLMLFSFISIVTFKMCTMRDLKLIHIIIHKQTIKYHMLEYLKMNSQFWLIMQKIYLFGYFMYRLIITTQEQ